jgi:hypothetical protein
VRCKNKKEYPGKTTIPINFGRYLRGGTDSNDLRSVSRADSGNDDMSVARLDSAILRNLHLGRTTLYDLCDEDDEALPVIIDRAFGQSIHVEMNGTPATTAARAASGW